MPIDDQSNDPTQVAETQALTGRTAGAGGYIGLLLKDRYRVEKELGRGGFGLVFLARDEQLLSKPVVVKILLDEAARGSWFEKKFRQEVEALARINHPGVVGALDAGGTPDGKPFLVMQFVEGVTLRSVIGAGGMDLGRVAHIMRQIGRALSAAHEKGVYHRDLKPENIMLQNPGEGEEYVKLIDFGIAGVRDSAVAGDGSTTRIAGSQAYMAPEQFNGRPSAASDIYALGVIACEMTTGRRPFPAESLLSLLKEQVEGPKVKPRDLRPSLPETAEKVILKALSFREEDRYARPRDFGDALALALAAAEGAEATGSAATAPVSPQLLPPQSAPLRTPGSPRSRTSGAEAKLSSQRSSPREMAPQSGPPREDAEGALEDPSARPEDPGAQPATEMAWVLFTDLVGYSRQPMERQREWIEQLKRIVAGTAEFRRAHARDELITLPTGDGMALVFFRDPEAPVQCALEIARALLGNPELKLRMGVHGGPVYRVADINTNRNAAGGGVNLAQRVMDCGDGGHILVSKSVADVLGQLSKWREYLHDLGEQTVKHGEKVHIYNLYLGELGNPKRPGKVARRRRWAVLPVAAVLALVIAGAVWFLAPKMRQMRPAPTAQAERMLDYSITVEKLRDGRPVQFQLPGEMIFEPGNKIRLNVSSPHEGYLYIINEGPESRNGMPSYNVLFPSPTANGGKALLAANQSVQIPQQSWFMFDKDTGTEKVWLIWAGMSLPELEALRGLVNPQDKGAVRDPVQVEAIHGLLQRHSGAASHRVDVTPESAVRDYEQKRTEVRDKGDVLVHLIRLEHQ